MEPIVTAHEAICEVVLIENGSIVSCPNDATQFDSEALEFRCSCHIEKQVTA